MNAALCDVCEKVFPDRGRYFAQKEFDSGIYSNNPSHNQFPVFSYNEDRRFIKKEPRTLNVQISISPVRLDEHTGDSNAGKTQLCDECFFNVLSQALNNELNVLESSEHAVIAAAERVSKVSKKKGKKNEGK